MPPAKLGTGSKTPKTPWVTFVIGVLSQRPGEWALVAFDDARKINAVSVLRTCESLEVKVEAVMRGGDLYMRLIP
jgi:hypothetical protein